MSNVLAHASSYYAEEPLRPGVSDRYTMIQTKEIGTAIEPMGWFPSSYNETRSRGIRQGKGRHMVRYHNDQFPVSDGMRPELLIANAHDGGGRLIVAAGPRVTVCWNGCIWPGEGGLGFKLFHRGLTIDAVINTILKVMTNIPWIVTAHNELSGIHLDDAQSLEYANRTIDLRWDRNAFKVNPADLISNPLAGQNSNSLWDRYQTIQRHQLQGGDIHVQNVVKNKSRKVQGVRRIAEDLRINSGLWEITKSFAAEVGHPLTQLQLN